MREAGGGGEDLGLRFPDLLTGGTFLKEEVAPIN